MISVSDVPSPAMVSEVVGAVREAVSVLMMFWRRATVFLVAYNQHICTVKDRMTHLVTVTDAVWIRLHE